MINKLDQIDKNIFIALNSLTGINNIVDTILKITTVYLVYLVPVLLILGWFYFRDPKIKKMLLAATLSGVVAWQAVAGVIGRIINRPRPIVDVAGAKEVLFHVPSHSFPSDHTTLLACISTYIYLSGYKKAGTWAWILTIIVAISRVIGGMHYLGDILAGVLIGILVAWIFVKINKIYYKYIIDPLYKIAQFLHLAPKK